MDGNTPINVFEPRMTQKEASEIAGVPMPTINNWIKRGEFTFGQDGEPRPDRRRLFSIADVARLHVMRFCTEHLATSPETAAFAANSINDFFGGGTAIAIDEEGLKFPVWHWVHRAPDFLGGERVWKSQGVWQHPQTGAFFQYHPGYFGTDDPEGPPHFPCICIPTSQLAIRMFLACCDALLEEHNDQTNVERQSEISEPGHDAPASQKDQSK